MPKSSSDGRWTILGQSFGGFCALTYLSIAPEGERAARGGPRRAASAAQRLCLHMRECMAVPIRRTRACADAREHTVSPCLCIGAYPFAVHYDDALLCAGLTDALLTGGIPPAVADACPAERTYRALYRRVLLQNRRYYAR